MAIFNKNFLPGSPGHFSASSQEVYKLDKRLKTLKRVVQYLRGMNLREELQAEHQNREERECCIHQYKQ